MRATPVEAIPTIGLLGRAYNTLSAEILKRVQDSGAPDIRPSHGNVMEQLTFQDPLRLSEIAERSGITPQSAGALVDELEALGYVRRRPDPDDRRAKLIHLTPKGRRNTRRSLEIVADIESRLRAKLGERRFASLRKALLELVES